MKLACPKNPGHDRFIATVPVEKSFMTDTQGNMLGVMIDATTQKGLSADMPWQCHICGAKATVEVGMDNADK